MKKPLSCFVIFCLTVHWACAQNDSGAAISLDGLYVAKTGSVLGAGAEIYTYLRFYRDGTVCLQAVNSNNPQQVSSWFGRFKRFSQKGSCRVNDGSILIEVDNKESKDIELEGLQQTTFKGTLTTGNELFLTRDNEPREFNFQFYRVSDTTVLKYALYKPIIKLPGEWKVKQVLKSTGQVFFTNEDSTTIGISVFKASGASFYKEKQTDYETAYAYFEWDSKYMQDTMKMEVRKISENREKAFVIWNARDEDNNNYHLFGKHRDLLYNIMIYDATMPVARQLKIIQALFELNE